MKRFKHNLSCTKLTSINQGNLVPIGWVEILPGDSIQHAVSLLLRTQPLNTPVMHPVSVRVHTWFVPNRLIWSSWENFITGGPDGLNNSTFPTITVNNVTAGSLADYLGIPIAVAQNVAVSALPFRAYAKIFNENYRDEDLTTAVGLSIADGADATTNVTLQNCAWEKDYFTSARPWAQKGNAVTLPLGTSAPVVPNNAAGFPTWTNTGVGANLELKFLNGNATTNWAANPGATINAKWADPNLKVDLTAATAATVNDLRLSLAVQRYQEARARYGSRFTEYLRYLGIKSSDARLDRPEYCGGSKATIQFSEVLQTGVTTAGVPGTGVGVLKGHGIGTSRSNRYRRFFEEHGILMTLLSVRPKTMYFEGLERKWNKRTKTDYWQKELQHIGQQEIKKKEIFLQGVAADEETWGFQDRYDEYRREESSVHGLFKSSLNTWHMARDFSGLPVLNNAFVTSDPTNRIYQDTSSSQLQVMVHHSMIGRRLVAKEGTSYIY